MFVSWDALLQKVIYQAFSPTRILSFFVAYSAMLKNVTYSNPHHNFHDKFSFLSSNCHELRWQFPQNRADFTSPKKYVLELERRRERGTRFCSWKWQWKRLAQERRRRRRWQSIHHCSPMGLPLDFFSFRCLGFSYLLSSFDLRQLYRVKKTSSSIFISKALNFLEI